MRLPTRKLIPVLVALAVAAAGYYGWRMLSDTGPGDGFISGNGRIEATEIDVAAKLAGRVQEVLAVEGDFVTAGQPLARMQIDTLQAQREEAQAQHQQAINAAASAPRPGNAAEATINLRGRSRRGPARKRTGRRAPQPGTLGNTIQGRRLVHPGADDDAPACSAQAAVHASRAQGERGPGRHRGRAPPRSARNRRSRRPGATIARIEADIADSELRAARRSRCNTASRSSGEVLGAGGKVLNMVDLSDVYMTFFLPEQAAGRVALGQDVRIVLDAAPGIRHSRQGLPSSRARPSSRPRPWRPPASARS